MNIPTISGTVMVSIIATGLILNFAARGSLGKTMQDIATYTTEGYGV